MTKEISLVENIIIHCSATKADMDVTEEQIRQWHKDRGWQDIGYHVVIRRGGLIEFGRPFDVRGAHAIGYNNNSIGVCLVGGLDHMGEPENNFTDQQWQSLKRVILGLRYLFPDADVLGHRDLPGVRKACPCFDVKEWMNHWSKSGFGL